MNWLLLQNSLLVSGLGLLLATALGSIVALTIGSAGPRLRSLLLSVVLMTLVLPPFLVTNCWIELVGQEGRWHSWLPFPLYSLPGAAGVLALLTWPITTLFTLSAWSRLEGSQLEIEPMLRGWTLVRLVLWPMARPALGQAAALIFVLNLNNFAVPVILQVRVFPEELWLAFTTRLDEAGAWVAGVPMVIAPILLLIVLRRHVVAWPGTGTPATAAAFRRQFGTVACALTATITGLVLLFSLALPLHQLLFSERTWAELPNLFRAASDTIWNSFAFASAAAILAVLIGLVTWRLPVGLITWLPFLIPGVLLGRTMISLFNGTVLSGSVGLVVAAYTLRYLAPSWNLLALARRSVDPDLSDAARVHGATGWRLFWNVHWPQLAAPVAAAWYVTYLLCLWDVETLVLIYPPGGETLALRIFNLLHYGHNAQVNAMCVTLLGLAGAPLAFWVIVRRCTHQFREKT